jgi:hypothetical protein
MVLGQGCRDRRVVADHGSGAPVGEVVLQDFLIHLELR